jgi:hypothetical protein
LVGRWRGGVSADKIEEREVNAPQRPYRAYSPRPVRPQERAKQRDGIEILFGGLHWRAEKLIQAVFDQGVAFE